MRRTVSRALLCASALIPMAAHAQEAQVPVQDSSSAVVPGADIVVTARKRAENLQSVPIAITAFTAEDIKSARIERLSDLAKLTPGLTFTPLFGRQNQLPIIRGAAQTFGALNVGVFLDGIYLSGKAGVDLELNDLQRIEVVKGPQSALYGRNTFAGAINYVTQRPSADLGGRIEATGGDHGLYKVLGSVSGPLGDTLRFRVGGFYRHFDGWYRSGIDGGRVDFEKSYGGIGTLEFKPTPAFTATLRASYSKDDAGQPPSSVIRDNAAPGSPPGSTINPFPGFPGFSTTRNLLFIGQVPPIPRDGVLVNTLTVPGQPSPYGDREENFRASATFEYDFGNATMTAISAFARRNAEYTFDGDNTVCDRTGGCPNFGFPLAPANPVGASRYALSSSDGFSRDISQELRFASSGKRTVDWLIGFFYYNNRNFSIDRGVSPITATTGVAPNTVPGYSVFNPNYAFPRITLDTQSYAVFVSSTYHATDRFAITGELRYEYEQQQFRQCPTFVVNPAPAAGTAAALVACGALPSPIVSAAPNTFGGGTTTYNLDQDFRFTTPRVILNYQLSPVQLVYASFARGAKTGGFNTNLNVRDDQRAYQPEYSDNFELGLKSDLFNRRLRLNLAGFYTNWRDQQAACQNPVAAGGTSTQRTYTCNVAASHIYGLEVEASTRLSELFSISANYAYTHARYTRFVDDSLAQTLIVAGLPPYQFDGRHLPYVPDHKFVVSPRLTLPFGGDIKVEARADLQYQSRTYLRADNLQSFAPKAVLDLRLSTQIDAFSVQLFANNVTNNNTPVAGVRFFDSTNYSVASPLVTGANLRQFGATVGVKF